MNDRRGGGERIPLYERPLSREQANRYVRVGAPLMGLGMALAGAAGLLVVVMIHTSDNDKELIAAVVLLFLLSYAVTVYGGIKWGHGRKQGGDAWLQPRDLRRLWAVAEYFWLIFSCVTAILGVVLAGVLAFGSVDQGLWGVVALTFVTCLTTSAMWRFARYRRQKLSPA